MKSSFKYILWIAVALCCMTESACSSKNNSEEAPSMVAADTIFSTPSTDTSVTPLDSGVLSVSKPLIYQVDLREDVNSVSWMQIQKGIDEAERENASVILLHMNTYGGEVLFADSIRTKILNARPMVVVFVDNNAASAGALISIACDKIYMRSSATMGASTVVNQMGAAAPDKYQSYMRATIRATAEAHGKDTIIQGKDTAYVWHRDPRIAEAMVDPDVYVAGIIDTGKVLTFTANEALMYGYCDAIVEDIPEIIEQQLGYSDYDLKVYQPSSRDRFKGHLMGTALRSILIMIIVAGIWFELQSPSIGFPSLAALVAAVLYFAPLYIDGLVDYWEIILFVVGVLLVFAEIFIIPGFGIAGILGILFVVTGLTFALVDNTQLSWDGMGDFGMFDEALLLVVISVLVAFLLCLWLFGRVGKGVFRNIALNTTQEKESGFVAVPIEIENKEMMDKLGLAATILRPAGKVRIDGKLYDAVAEFGYIEEGEPIRVSKVEAGQLYVRKIEK